MTANTAHHSALYEGRVSHARFGARSHHFRYKVAMVYLDLDELPAVFAQSRWWSLERRNLIAFFRRDYHNTPALPLKQAVLATVARECGLQLDGPVRMLTNVRHCGFIINPITCYYCFDAAEKLRAVVAEVTNTPWRERHCYVLPVDDNGCVQTTFAKAMHVSPFMPMELRYHWRSTPPTERLGLHMTLTSDDAPVFRAALQLQRQPLDARAMQRLLWRHPLMTMEVGLGIYWQALKLWFKRIAVHPHPRHLRKKPSTTATAPT
jgi:DUF1365 family protein